MAYYWFFEILIGTSLHILLFRRACDLITHTNESQIIFSHSDAITIVSSTFMLLFFIQRLKTHP